MLIRPYRPPDLDAVCRLLAAGYRFGGQVGDYTPAQVAWLLANRAAPQLVAREAAAQDAWLVAERGGGPVGVVALHQGELERLYVDPAHHGQGIGRALFDAALARARRDGAAALRLVAAESAVGFYEGRGMRVVERRPLTTGIFAGQVKAVLRIELALGGRSP